MAERRDLLFLDANVLFAAAYRPGAGVVRLWRMPGVELLTSRQAVEEARCNLSREDQRLRLEGLLTSVRIVPAALPREGMSGYLLPEDRPIAGAASAAGATYLLTGDRRGFGAYFGEDLFGVRVLTPSEYLSVATVRTA